MTKILEDRGGEFMLGVVDVQLYLVPRCSSVLLGFRVCTFDQQMVEVILAIVADRTLGYVLSSSFSVVSAVT